MAEEKRTKRLVDENNERILMCGYNGTPPSGDNNCEYVNNDGELVTKPEVVHAEENVILFLPTYLPLLAFFTSSCR